MKKRLLCSTVLSVLLIFVMSITAYAATNASTLFSEYSANLTANGTTLTVEIDVVGKQVCDTIGASQVIIQKKVNGVWQFEANLGSSYSYNSISHIDSLNYTGTSGKEYRAVVTFYACKGSTSDTKTVTTQSVIIQ
jgi:hypothetical protein